jgi:hypothetical protein
MLHLLPRGQSVSTNGLCHIWHVKTFIYLLTYLLTYLFTYCNLVTYRLVQPGKISLASIHAYPKQIFYI